MSVADIERDKLAALLWNSGIEPLSRNYKLCHEVADKVLAEYKLEEISHAATAILGQAAGGVQEVQEDTQKEESPARSPTGAAEVRHSKKESQEKTGGTEDDTSGDK